MDNSKIPKSWKCWVFRLSHDEIGKLLVFATSRDGHRRSASRRNVPCELPYACKHAPHTPTSAHAHTHTHSFGSTTEVAIEKSYGIGTMGRNSTNWRLRVAQWAETQCESLCPPRPACWELWEMHAGRLTLGAHVPPQGLWGFGNWELAQWASTQQNEKQNYYNHELGVGLHKHKHTHTHTHTSLTPTHPLTAPPSWRVLRFLPILEGFRML